MKRSTLSSVSAGLVFLLTLSGCSREERGAAASNSSSVGAASASGLSLRILPERPTVRDDVYVLVSGKAQDVRLQWLVNGERVESAASTRLSSVHFRKGDRVAVFSFADAMESSAQVDIENGAPEVTGVSLAPGSFHRGIDVTALPQAFDPDGDPVFFSLQWSVNGEEVSDTGETLSGDRFQRGDRLSLKVVPFDGDLKGPPYMTGDMVVPNAPPRFVTVPPTTFKSRVYSYTAQAEDPDGDVLTYSLDAAPHGMQIDEASGLVHWILEETPAGEHTVRISVSDSQGEQALQEFRLNLDAGEK